MASLSSAQIFVLSLLMRHGNAEGEVPAQKIEAETSGIVGRHTFNALIKRGYVEWLTPPPDHSNVFRYRITIAGRDAFHTASVRS